ncbi:Intraflagellar transport protein 74 [Merluccius polli]|uniref:Intraflagellar transport protein 74 n=1 Tax=Merluccius polli TaxID=89951 RepID=A0AA47MZN8_MERPO|nr:Intraflagellar transport protein 74 [Merluccius polli]
MLVDKLNTNTDMEEVMNDYNFLKVRNDREAESMDIIFTERREREEAIGVTGEAIKKERHIADEVIKALPPAEHDKYAAMMLTNEELLQEQSVCQEELEAMLTRKETFEAELSHSPMKQEAVCIQEKLWMLEARRDSMEAENKNFDSPQEEREKLFKQVKDNNQEIASMDRQLGEMSERGEQIIEEISQLEHHTDEVQVECRQKYKELKRREEEIDRFLELFEEARVQEMTKSTQQQNNIVILLEQSSKNLSSLHQIAMVTVSQLKSMHEVLSNKEKEVVQSQTTARGLTTESHRLQQDLEKVQQLEGKITGELGALKEQIVTMKAELLTYCDLDTLKSTAEIKKKTLQEDCVSMTQQRDYLRQLLQQLNKNYEGLKSKLKENETHTQLANMERKWQHLEQNNFLDPLSWGARDILQLLQEMLEAGKSPTTLRGMVAAIKVARVGPWKLTEGCCDLINHFLKGVRRVHPSQGRPPAPPWDLETFEPLETVGLQWLSLKTAFMLAIVTAKRIGELHALSVHEECCRFLPDDAGVVLRPNPAFHPKVWSDSSQSFELHPFNPPQGGGIRASVQTSPDRGAGALNTEPRYLMGLVARCPSIRDLYGGLVVDPLHFCQVLLLIASKAQESNYAFVSQTVIQQLKDYNRGLTDVLQNNRS